MKLWTFILTTGYLLGSVPFGYLLVRVFEHRDVRSIGSGNIGATNVLRSGNKKLGIATLLLDLAKAFAAVALAQHLAASNEDLAVAAAAAAVIGHCFPLWLGFRGGKGVASALGAFLALSWPTAVCGVAVFAAIVVLSRYVSLASLTAAATLPLFALHFIADRSALALTGLIGIPLLVILKHHGNIRRLIGGTESRFGERKATV
jgi:glycerol-3-phosphate acyltransferase PlsY